MQQPIGRYNRARIARDRYELGTNPPVYKISLYASSRDFLMDDDEEENFAPPRLQAPPAAKSSSALTRSQVLARDLLPSNYRVRMPSKVLPTQSPPQIVQTKSSSMDSPPLRPIFSASPTKIAPSTVVAPAATRPQERANASPVKAAPMQHEEIPKRVASPAMRKALPLTTRYIHGSAVDSMVKQALRLQQEGNYDDAHVLLLQVERLRLEEEKAQQVEKPQVVRRASVVLEQVKLEQQQQPSIDDEFDSLESSSGSSDNEEEEGKQDALPSQSTSVIQPQQPVPVIPPQQPAPVIQPQQPASVIQQQQPAPVIQPQQPAPVIQQQPSALNTSYSMGAARAAAAAALAEYDNTVVADDEEEEEDLVEKDSVPMAPSYVQAHQVSALQLERERANLRQQQQQQSASPARVRRKSQTEELLERVFLREQPHHQAIAFSDQQQQQPLEMETVTVDEEEAKATLRTLNRELTSSCLPEASSFKATTPKQEVERMAYTNKEGYLLKLSENPTAFSRFRSQKSLTHKRYFRLAGRTLVHSKTRESKVPRGMIALDDDNAVVVEFVRCEGIQFGYCVAIKADARNYTLFPESKQDAVEWVVALEHNIKLAQREKQEEAKLAARRRLLEESYKLNASFSMITPEHVQELVGKDVTSSDFPDFATLHGSNQAMGNNIGALYDLLGVQPNASITAIKKQYHRLAKVLHPDKQSSAMQQQKFAQVNHAFHVLSDEELRSRYDQGERVKYALRRGVQVCVVETDGTRWQAALYIGPSFKFLYYQPIDFGHILQPGYHFCELRFVQEIQAAEDCSDWPDTQQRCNLGLRISGQRLGVPVIFLELDVEDSRNEILDGLRTLRIEQSVLFQQTLQKWLDEGKR